MGRPDYFVGVKAMARLLIISGLLLIGVMPVEATAWTLTTIAAFNGNNGASPSGSLISDRSGNLYGTTSGGGTSAHCLDNNGDLIRCGTVFKLTKTASVATPYTLSTLLMFNGTNGSFPMGSLIKDSAGNLYGTTSGGGGVGYGTVFELKKPTAPSTTYQFSNIVSLDSDQGADPMGSLFADSAGNFYATTSSGAAYGYGSVFKLDNSVSVNGSYRLTPIASFNYGDGFTPYGDVIADCCGSLYGTTSNGGRHNQGTVFMLKKLAPISGQYSLRTIATLTGTNGAFPFGSLIVDGLGNFYGTTSSGGPGGGGTVFKLAKPTTVNGAYILTTIGSFNGTNGSAPMGNLLADSSGNLYGTASAGGPGGCGIVFKLTKPAAAGLYTLSIIAAFSGPNGSTPMGSLIADNAGNFYGTTSRGGKHGNGTVFKLSP
jgi:uncharacterized repeat protein (TIGR03803 family)